MSKNYFSHDYNTAADPKIALLLSEFGGIGYAVFWRLIEMLHIEPAHKLERKRFLYVMLAKQLASTEENIIKILELCFGECELFTCDETHFWSNRVFRNIEKKEEKYQIISEIRSEIGRKGGLAKASKSYQKVAKASKPYQTLANPSQSKVNKIKINNTDLYSCDLSNKSNICDSQIIVAAQKKIAQPAERRKKLPDDFCVTDAHRELAKKNDWSNLEQELEAFRDYHVSKGNTMLDWDRAFYTWLRNAKKFNSKKTRGEKNGSGNSHSTISKNKIADRKFIGSEIEDVEWIK